MIALVTLITVVIRENGDKYNEKPILSDISYFFETTVAGKNSKIKGFSTNFPRNYSNKLIFRIPEFSCSSGVNREMDNLAEFMKLNGKDKVIILTDFSNKRNYRIFKATFGSDLQIINEVDLETPLDDLDSPYYFLLDREKKAHNIFYPLQSDNSYSLRYLETIRTVLRKRN